MDIILQAFMVHRGWIIPTFHLSPSWGWSLLGKCLNIFEMNWHKIFHLREFSPFEESSWLFLLHHHGVVFVNFFVIGWIVCRVLIQTPMFPSGWTLITWKIIWLFIERKMFYLSDTCKINDNISLSYVVLITKWFHAASGPGCQHAGSQSCLSRDKCH